MTALTIRSACIDDAEAVFELLTQFVTSYQPQRDAFDRNFPKLLAGDNSVFLVAEIDEVVVGYTLGAIMLTLYANGPILELQELMVAPQHRGQGFGRMLVEAALVRAQASGCTEATVPTRRAREFYLGLGFVDSATYLKRRLEP